MVLRQEERKTKVDLFLVIDDIRYFITSNVQTYSQMDEAKERLLLIDKLLEELNLDAWATVVFLFDTSFFFGFFWVLKSWLFSLFITIILRVFSLLWSNAPGIDEE